MPLGGSSYTARDENLEHAPFPATLTTPQAAKLGERGARGQARPGWPGTDGKASSVSLRRQRRLGATWYRFQCDAEAPLTRQEDVHPPRPRCLSHIAHASCDVKESGNVSGGAALSSCSASNQSYGSNYNVASACSG